MMSIRHLLAATDLSASSLHAVDRGFEIARSTGAHYTVMHALELDALAPLRALLGGKSASVAQKIADEARAELLQILADRGRNRGVSAGLHLEQEGRPTTAVLAHADAIAADLVVLGAQGKGYVQRFLLGSTASRVLRKSRSPVLVVKQACAEPYRRVLVAVDLAPASALAVSIARAAAPGAEIILLHVYEVPFEGMYYSSVNAEEIDRYRVEARDLALAQLHELAKSAELIEEDYTPLVLAGNPARQILQQETTQQCDLIVVGKHGSHEIEELLLGSVANHVLNESRADVLVVTDSRKPAPASIPDSV